LVAKAGKVVLYISASEHDAERRYLSAETLFSEIGVKAQLVPSDLSKAQNDALERNELQVVFGTDRLLNPENQHKVGLVIIEDTEEEGIVQKMARVTPKKKVMPDILLFTPSPLPLSSLEKFFSGMSLSVLKTPKISHPSTVISTAEERKDVYAAVDAQLKEGRQAYIVLPRQKEKDLLSLADALSMAGKVREAFLPEARIGVYSTEMSRLERMRVFEDFQHKRIDVLFCTAHIEDVPAVRNVACVVLEFADKNSFMRVHRLRGLLYGSYYDACCYLIPSPQTSAEKLDKLRQIAHQTDGFALAEQAPSLPIPYRWLKGESSLRLKARSLIQKINSGDVQRGRWPLLIHHIEGLWPKETENLEFTSTRKLKKRRGRKNRR
jgi:RecG-like helicase